MVFPQRFIRPSPLPTFIKQSPRFDIMDNLANLWINIIWSFYEELSVNKEIFSNNIKWS